MDIVRVIFIVVGLIAIAIEAAKKSPNSFSAGWLGVLLVGIGVLIQIAVK